MIEVGSFAIVGDWDDTVTPDTIIRIVMPPLGHIFGAGWHTHTQVALYALKEHLKPGMTFAEIGAGSAILSVAAMKIGAKKAYATEINPDALVAAKRVISANDVKVTLVDGTFLEQEVDLAIISISSSFAHDNLDKIKAKKVLLITDTAEVEVYER